MDLTEVLQGLNEVVYADILWHQAPAAAQKTVPLIRASNAEGETGHPLFQETLGSKCLKW